MASDYDDYAAKSFAEALGPPITEEVAPGVFKHTYITEYSDPLLVPRHLLEGGHSLRHDSEIHQQMFLKQLRNLGLPVNQKERTNGEE